MTEATVDFPDGADGTLRPTTDVLSVLRSTPAEEEGAVNDGTGASGGGVIPNGNDGAGGEDSDGGGIVSGIENAFDSDYVPASTNENEDDGGITDADNYPVAAAEEAKAAGSPQQTPSSGTGGLPGSPSPKRRKTNPIREAARQRREEADKEVEEAKKALDAATERYETAVRRREEIEDDDDDELEEEEEEDYEEEEAPKPKAAKTKKPTKKGTASAKKAGKQGVELDQPLVWNKMYKKLAQYVVENGHCFPPASDKDDPEKDAIYKWVIQQRRYRASGRMEKNRPDRLEALDKLGFVWDAKKEVLRRRLAEMQVYLAEHGNLNIPFKYPPCQQLATWVHENKKEYKKFQRGLPTTMTEERVQTLERAGFQWACASSRKRKRAADGMTEEELWQDGYRKLIAFHEKHGDCRVTRGVLGNGKKTNDLTEWVAWQRRQYKLLQEGKPSQMTQERIEKMEALGFVWEKSYSAYCSKNNIKWLKGERG